MLSIVEVRRSMPTAFLAARFEDLMGFDDLILLNRAMTRFYNSSEGLVVFVAFVVF